MSTEKTAVDVQFLCRVFDLTPRRIQQLEKQGVIRKAARGQYEFLPSVIGYVRYLQERLDENANPSTHEEAFLAARARLYQARAKEAEADAALRAGTVYPAEIVEQVWTEMAINFRSQILAIPTRFSPMLTDQNNVAAIRKILEEALSHALEELAKFDSSAIINRYRESRVESPGPASEDPAEPVGGPESPSEQ